jgi:hypothetical protein
MTIIKALIDGVWHGEIEDMPDLRTAFARHQGCFADDRRPSPSDPRSPWRRDRLGPKLRIRKPADPYTLAFGGLTRSAAMSGDHAAGHPSCRPS